MLYCKEEPIFHTVDSRQREGKLYSMLVLRYGGVRRFVFYVGNGHDGSLALFEGSDGEANQLFETMVREGLSEEHLCDVVRDANGEINFLKNALQLNENML